jgi:hypothetical protein
MIALTDAGRKNANLFALALAFACVGANTLSTVAGDALFVSTFSLGSLSRFLIVAAFIRFASSMVYAVLARRFEHRPWFDVGVLSATAVMLAVCGALTRSTHHGVLYAVCLAQLVLPPLLPLIAWNACARGLDARSAKKVLPMIAAASTLGAIVCGASAGAVVSKLGRPAVWFLSAIIVGVGAWLLSRLPTEAGPRSRVPVGFLAALGGSISDVRRIPAVRTVVWIGIWGLSSPTCLTSV